MRKGRFITRAPLALFLLLPLLAAAAPAQAGPVTWPSDGLFPDPLVVMYTTKAASADEMTDYTDVDLYVLLPGSKGVPLNDPTDPTAPINSAAVCRKAEMHIRGQSTLGFPKKQFAVKVKGLCKGQKKVERNFLGMDYSGEHWVFNAPGFVDPTMIRNVMAFDMQRQLGMNTGSNAWAPRTKYFEFFAVFNKDGSTPLSVSNIKNGYLGVYINFEEIRGGTGRLVNLGDTYSVPAGARVGGLLAQVNPEDPAKRQQILSDQSPDNAGNSSPVFLQWPELDYFNGGGGTQQELTDIENWFYNPSQTGDFLGWAYLFKQNCTTGPQTFLPQATLPAACQENGSYWSLVEKYTDLQSFAEYLLLNELAKDPDGFHKSTFMYRDPDTPNSDKTISPGKLYGGPLWDKNKSYSNYGGTFDSPEGWLFTTANCGQAPWWWPVLSQYDSFQALVTAAWQSAYNTTGGNGAFDYSRIETFVNTQMNYLLNTGSFARDQQLWHATDPAEAKTQLQTDVNSMLSYIQSRLTWMNANLPNLGQAVSTDCN
jgi:hypothetical protein